MANKCELWVNNQIFGGWTEISIQRGIEQMSGSFSLTVTERWPRQLEVRPIQTGDSCVVKIDGVAVVTGYSTTPTGCLLGRYRLRPTSNISKPPVRAIVKSRWPLGAIPISSAC